ncbi:MAG: germination protein YpeB [Clostridia bacterium]|nr:germination protein YpeB [Clostridia bacterium]
MKKETKIAVNKSSGAEKVETVEKQVKKVKTPTAKGDAALGDSVKAEKVNAQSSGSPAEKESAAAKARVEAALKRKEMQAKRKEERAKKQAEKAALRKKRMADKKARTEKRLAERKALAEKRAAEREERIRERAHAKANKRQEQSKKRAQKSNRKKEGNRKSREKGYGGWIAAVVTLGVTTLALATTVAVGGVEMANTRGALMGAHKGTMYELTGITDNMNDDLDRVRVSNSPIQQSRILTDLLVQARLAEADLGKLPIDGQQDKNMTEFFNRTAWECERMLVKLRNGGKLSEEDIAKIEELYRVNQGVREELSKLTNDMTDKDLMGYIKEGEGMVSEALQRLENATLQENRPNMEKPKTDGAGMSQMPKTEEVKIEPAHAQELCKGYFQKYGISEYQCVGETVARDYSAYNMQGYDEKGTMLFAEVSQADGKLLRFDYYEECTAENFDIDNAERIAEEFLQSLGYEELTVARFRENGTMTDFTFVYEKDGVAYYPDEVRVKVCRTRGVVTGMDATKYIKNHRDRDEVNTKITLAEAYDKLCDKLSVESSRLAVVNTARGERPAYEFLCSYEDMQYFVFLDADSGEEIAIINAKKV